MIGWADAAERIEELLDGGAFATNLEVTEAPRYLRKMAIDGYVVKLDLPELRELVSLLRYSSNNLNQLTRRAHETGRIYEADLEDIQQSQERIWTAAEKIVSSLAALK